MSNINAPRGFKPLRYVDGRPFSGATGASYHLPSGYGTAIAAGDVVKLLTTGYLAKANPGDQMRGVVLGFRYVDPVNQLPRFVSYWPAGQVTMNGQDAIVEVADDAGLVFEAVFTNSAAVPALGQTGKLFNLIDTGIQAGPQLSGEGIDLTTQSTVTGQFRALQAVGRADNDTTSAYQRWEFVPALHDFRVNTGV